MSMSKEPELELDWIQLHNELSPNTSEETNKARMRRKFQENPFVPIGVLATTAALGYGLWSFHTGNRRMSQYMMRTRIVAQGFTVVALIVGLGVSASKKLHDDKT